MKRQVDPHIWQENEDHLVLFMDIMGFKDRVTRTRHNELLKTLTDFKDLNDRLKPLLKDDTGELLRMVQFSDSIIIASMNSNKQSLNRIVKAAVVLMQNALESGLALKGAIAMGSLTFDAETGIYFGLPIVDAYLLEEELKFYGVAFHHSVEPLIENYIKNPPQRGRQPLYAPIEACKLQLKTGQSSHYCVSYHKMSKVLAKADDSTRLSGLVKNIGKTVSGAPRIYIDNTLKFFEENPFS